MAEIKRTQYQNAMIEELAELWSCSIADADVIAALITRTTQISFRELAALARAGMLEFKLTQLEIDLT